MNKLFLAAALSIVTLAACSSPQQSSAPQAKTTVAGSAGPGSANIPVTVMNPNGTTTTTTNTVYAPK